MTRQRRVPPLVIEWEPDSDLIGDFVWGGVSFEMVTRLSVASELKKHFSGFEICALKMIEGTAAGRSQGGRGRRKEDRIRLPYAGPDLCEIWVDTWASLDDERSGLELERVCGTCGFRFYKSKCQGLVLGAHAKKNCDFFRVHQFPGWIFCTGRARDFIKEKEYSNVAFRDVR